jgi:sugar/nucleoside kinase (ribokinase family)
MNTTLGAWSPLQPTNPDTTSTQFSLAIIGDVRIEFRAQLRDRRFVDLTENHLSYTEAQGLVAGTAINMARCSVGCFRTVTVIGKIGNDAFTPVIQRSLHQLGVHDLLTVETGVANGFTMMLHDHAAHERGSIRLLVASEATPSRLLSAVDVRRHTAVIEEVDVLFVDGYALLSPTSGAALRTAARIARSAGTLVAFDLVPHDIDARLPLAEILPALMDADVIISEASSMARLIGHQPVRDLAAVPALLAALDLIHEGRPLWLLRCGANNLEHAVAYRRNDLLLEYPTGYGADGELVGYGDRLAVSELCWWLSRVSGQSRACAPREATRPG